METNLFPKIHHYRSRTTEAINILFTARCIYNSFFKEKNFYVLPCLIKNSNKTIYFPRLSFINNNFWKKSLILHKQVENNNEVYVRSIANQIPYNAIDETRVTTEFNYSLKKYWKEIVKTWPKFFENVNNIDIYISEFGSVASQYSSFLKDPSRIRIFVRYDSNIKEIYKMIFFERIKVLRPYVKYEWSEIMAVCESFVNDTFLGEINDIEYRTLTSTRSKKGGNIVIESEKYLKEMGFGIGGSFNIRLGNIFFNDQVINLPKQPHKLLTLLIEKYPQTISYEDIALQIWGDTWTNNFSIESITQIAKRTRSSVNKYGISSSTIQSIRGKGYVLVNNC